MRTHLVLSSLLGLSALAACTPQASVEERASTHNDLNASNAVLWPVEDGVATIPVCWMPAKVDPNRYPVKAFGPSDDFIEERKEWVREVVETEWNARTPLAFTGWKNCGADRARFVQLVPIDSMTTPPCGAAGQACAEALGSLVRGKKTYINVAFGDEFLYASRFLQATPEERGSDANMLRERKDGSLYWLPGACLEELKSPWWTAAVSKEPMHRQNIQDPNVLANAQAIMKSCLQYNALHELGHVAAFAHEQYRDDDAKAQAECLKISEQRGFTDDLASVSPDARGDRPLGPFDTESIMSYCRTDNSPTLTEQDVEMTRAVYSGSSNDGEDGEDGKDGRGDGDWGGSAAWGDWNSGGRGSAGVDGEDGQDGESY